MPQSDADAVEALHQALEAADYQTALPASRTLSPTRPPPEALIDGAKVALVIGVIFALAVVVFVVFSAFKKKREDPEPAVLRATDLGGSRLDVDLDQVRALGAAGRYGEALHRLLALTLAKLVELAKIHLDPAWTSREIGARIAMPAGARTAFGELVRAVELSHFGGRKVGAEDLEQGLALHRAFVEELARERP